MSNHSQRVDICVFLLRIWFIFNKIGNFPHIILWFLHAVEIVFKSPLFFLYPPREKLETVSMWWPCPPSSSHPPILPSSLYVVSRDRLSGSTTGSTTLAVSTELVGILVLGVGDAYDCVESVLFEGRELWLPYGSPPAEWSMDVYVSAKRYNICNISWFVIPHDQMLQTPTPSSKRTLLYRASLCGNLWRRQKEQSSTTSHRWDLFIAPNSFQNNSFDLSPRYRKLPTSPLATHYSAHFLK